LTPHNRRWWDREGGVTLFFDGKYRPMKWRKARKPIGGVHQVKDRKKRGIL